MKNRILLVLVITFSYTIQSQNIYNIAGNGFIGNGGDGGPATNASLNMPIGIAADAAGNTYFSDAVCSCVRKINPSGIINTIAGIPGFGGYSGDGGLATLAQLNAPWGIAVDGSGNIYIADNGVNVIRKIDASGIITTIAGAGTSTNDGILASTSSLALTTAITVDNSGNLYIVDGSRIRKINQLGIINTVAGKGTAGFSGDGGLATSAELYSPEAIAIDGSGNLFIADGNKHCIRKVNSSGIINTIAGIGGVGGYSGDGGPATSAKLSGPSGIAVDSFGNVYFSDNDRLIRKINTTGVISTIAGTIVVAGYNGSGIPAISATLNFPKLMVTDGSGNLYFCDRDNHRIRVICMTDCLAGIYENNLEHKLKLYPNPTDSILNIEPNYYIQEDIQVLIVNSLGQEIIKTTFNKNTKIDVSDLPEGYYFLKISTPDKQVFHSKFIKQ